MAHKIRYVLLCEDRRQERFLRKVAHRLGLEQIRVIRAPSGRGSAAQFVLESFPQEVKALRAKAYQRNLGLITAIDGDRHGARQRHQQLNAVLLEASLEERKPGERIAIEAPTWSVETWLGHLSGVPGIDESTSYKEAAWLRSMDEITQRLEKSADRFKELLDDEHANVPELPSLGDGLEELRRFTEEG